MRGLSLEAVVTALRTAGCVFAEEEAALMLAESETDSDLNRMIQARSKGVPLEHILGWAEFYGFRVGVAPGIFVPRYKTEFLAGQAIALCEPDSVVLDLCCGSGAIGLAIISNLPSIQLISSDVDPIAVSCSKQNLGPFGVEVFEGDLFDSIPEEWKGRIKILVANAPYVPTESIDIMPREARLYEPTVSLDGGLDGLEVHRRIAIAAPEWLASGGHLLIETGENQASIAADLFEKNGMSSRIVFSDEYDSTVIIGTKRVNPTFL